MLGKAARKMWGCDEQTASVINIGFDEAPIDRCPLALFRDSPHEAALARWAASAAGSFESGNMAWFMAGAEMSVAGAAAFDLFSAASAKRLEQKD